MHNNKFKDTKSTPCDKTYNLSDLVPFTQFKKREKVYGGVLLLVKLQA